ncbi:hypothetical protein CR513_58544, partial [Mucuna pruriens]
MTWGQNNELEEFCQMIYVSMKVRNFGYKWKNVLAKEPQSRVEQLFYYVALWIYKISPLDSRPMNMGG